MKKRSTGSDEANLRQVVVEQPKMMKKEMSIREILGKEEKKSNKSGILDADGVRRRRRTSSVGSDMMDEIDDILRDDGGSTSGDIKVDNHSNLHVQVVFD